MENDPHPAVAGVANAPQALPGLERYGRYCLIERIGRGGMAEVFRAVAQGVEGFRRVFVIKRIRPEKSDSAELIRMFCDEARLSALLHHPNIVQVYDFGQINGTYFLAMEYLRGKDLSAVMRATRAARGAISPPLAAHIAQQVATALHYAHTLTRMDGKVLRVVHRDVTPSNIMLQRTGAVKMLDFGIAQATNFARQAETGGGRVKGKLAYLSPEQVRLEPLDGRSDVFALGVVLWEMLTGQRLFSGENEFLTMRNVLTQPVPPPSSKRAEVPAALDAIVARALQRDRDKRYPSAQDMADELERFLQAVPCPSQGLARLLHQLFGEETTDHTPDLPELGVVAAPAAPPARVPEPIIEIDAEPGTSSARGLAKEAADAAALALTSGASPVAIAYAGSVAPDAAAPVAVPRAARLPLALALALALPLPLPPHRPLARRLVVGVASAMLVACFSWAMWRGKHPASSATKAVVSSSDDRAPGAQIAHAVVAGSPAPSTPAQSAPAAERSLVPVAVVYAQGRDGATATAAAASSLRARAGKKRPPRHLSSDVTLDPFK